MNYETSLTRLAPHLPHPHGLQVIAKEVRPSYIYACMFLKKTAASFLNSSSDQQLEDSSSFYFFQTHISEEGIKLTKMPANFCGSWEIISNVNFEGYMIALGKSLKHVVLTQQCSQILHLC